MKKIKLNFEINFEEVKSEFKERNSLFKKKYTNKLTNKLKLPINKNDSLVKEFSKNEKCINLSQNLNNFKKIKYDKAKSTSFEKFLLKKKESELTKKFKEEDFMDKSDCFQKNRDLNEDNDFFENFLENKNSYYEIIAQDLGNFAIKNYNWSGFDVLEIERNISVHKIKRIFNSLNGIKRSIQILHYNYVFIFILI